MACCSCSVAPAVERTISLDDERLVLWLDASDESTISVNALGNVLEWRDRSNHHNDMHADDSGVIRWLVPPRAFDPGIVVEPIDDTLRAIHFQWLRGKSYGETFSFGGVFSREVAIDAADWLVIAVAKHANADDGLLFGGLDAPARNGPCLFTGERAIGTSGFALENATRPWNDEAFHAYAFAVDGVRGAARLLVDGTVTTLSSEGAGVRSVRHFLVGGIMQNRMCAEGCTPQGRFVTSAIDGSIAELMVFRDTNGSPRDLDFLNRYLQAKYGLTL